MPPPANPLGELAYRLTGILLLVLAVRMIPETVAACAWVLPETEVWSSRRALLVTGQLVPMLFLSAGALFLILRSSRLASGSSTDQDAPARGASSADVQRILLTTAGIVLIGLALPAIPRALYNLANALWASPHDLGPDRSPSLAFGWAWVAGLVIQAGFGVLVILKGSNLVSLLHRRFDRAEVVAADGRCPHCGVCYEAEQYRPGAVAYLCGNCRQELPREEIARLLGQVPEEP